MGDYDFAAAAGLSRIPGGADPWASIATGGASEIAARVTEYIEAGVSKFVMRPLASSDEDLMDQTRRLADEVLPLFSARR